MLKTGRTLCEEGQRKESGSDGAEEHDVCQEIVVGKTKESGCFESKRETETRARSLSKPSEAYGGREKEQTSQRAQMGLCALLMLGTLNKPSWTLDSLAPFPCRPFIPLASLRLHTDLARSRYIS